MRKRQRKKNLRRIARELGGYVVTGTNMIMAPTPAWVFENIARSWAAHNVVLGEDLLGDLLFVKD